jgi:hypothetical protein
MASNQRPSTDGLNAAIEFCNDAQGWTHEVIKDGDDEITIRFIGPDSADGQMLHQHADIWHFQLARFGVRAR